MAVARQRNSDLDAALADARERYAAVRPNSARIHQRAREVLPGGNTRSVLFYTPFPAAMVRGEGCLLEDVDNHRYVDFCGEYTAGLFGHSEPRIRAAMVSGYLNTFRDCIMSVSHCIDNYVPGILNWAEMYDVGGLVAPRPLFVESGERDDIFPIGASRESFARVKKVYETFDAGALTEQETFDGPHSFWGKRGLPFLAKHLAG